MLSLCVVMLLVVALVEYAVDVGASLVGLEWLFYIMYELVKQDTVVELYLLLGDICHSPLLAEFRQLL